MSPTLCGVTGSPTLGLPGFGLPGLFAGGAAKATQGSSSVSAAALKVVLSFIE